MPWAQSHKLSFLFALISQIISVYPMALNASRWVAPKLCHQPNLNPKLLNVLAYFAWMLKATQMLTTCLKLVSRFLPTPNQCFSLPSVHLHKSLSVLE